MPPLYWCVALQQALERATGNEEIMAIAERILSQSYPSDPAAGSALAVQSNQRDISTVLVDAGVGFVKSNPIKMFLWLAGLLLLQFATGEKLEYNISRQTQVHRWCCGKLMCVPDVFAVSQVLLSLTKRASSTRRHWIRLMIRP
jgi:hypothetical protein